MAQTLASVRERRELRKNFWRAGRARPRALEGFLGLNTALGTFGEMRELGEVMVVRQTCEPASAAFGKYVDFRDSRLEAWGFRVAFL